MNEKQYWFNKIKLIILILTSFGTLVIAYVGWTGKKFIIQELEELRKQNTFTETHLKQTYRPLGVVITDLNNPKQIKLEYPANKSKDKFSIKTTYHLFNFGQGVLSYIGHFSKLTTEGIDFRYRLINGEFDSLNVDFIPIYGRRTTIIPSKVMENNYLDITVLLKDIPFKKEYYLYTLLLYEDQYGNLYDTEHLDKLPFNDPVVKGERLIPSINKDKYGLIKDTYHYYSESDKAKLISAIRSLSYPKDHNIADFLEGLR